MRCNVADPPDVDVQWHGALQFEFGLDAGGVLAITQLIRHSVGSDYADLGVRLAYRLHRADRILVQR